jgi:hypothetical protein
VPNDLLELRRIEARIGTCVCDSRHREKNVTMFSTVDWS